MYLKTSKTKRRKVSSYLWSHMTRKRRTTVFKHTPLKRPWKDSICRKTSFNLCYRVWTKQQAVLKRFMDLLKTSRLKRLSDRVIRCHLSFTFSLWTRSTRDGKTTPSTIGKRVTVSLTIKHLQFLPQDTRMTQ